MKKQLDVVSWLLLIVLALMWGSSFILMKQALKAFSPVQVGTTRIFISFLALLPGWFFVKLKKVEPRQYLFLFLVGLFSNAIPAVLFPLAQTKIASSLAGILNSLVPLFTLLIGIFLFSMPMLKRKLLGVLIGLAGAASLILFRAETGSIGHATYALLVVLAAIFYGAGVNVLKSKLGNLSPITITTISFSFVGPIAGLLAWGFGSFDLMREATPATTEALMYLVILAIVGTSFSLILFNYLVQRTNALFASGVTYMIPIVAVMWGVLDGEPMSAVHVLGLGLILIGIYLSK